MVVNILGQDYSIVQDESIKKTQEADGVCQMWDKMIKIVPPESMLENEDSGKAKELRYQEVMRHEIIHAFFAESGLDEYCMDETLVAWIAKQFPKMMKLFSDIECLY